MAKPKSKATKAPAKPTKGKALPAPPLPNNALPLVKAGKGNTSDTEA